MKTLLQLMDEKVVIFDGAMGTSLQAQDLSLDDFEGLEGCNELLSASRPDAVRRVHDEFLAAGADVVETNTFGGVQVVLAEYGIEHRAHELALRSAKLAREVADAHSTPERPRFVCGSIGPGTKLPSLGHIGYRELRDAFLPLAAGLVEGGVDALIVETCQDILQAKAALDAVRLAVSRSARQVPVMASVTIEATGTMLVGSDIAAAAAALLPLGVDSLGLNCATGPDQMVRHLQYLSRHGAHRLSVMPNAGLPQNIDGRGVYPLGPEELADWLERFVREEGAGIVGGCCGTVPAHIKAVADRVGGLEAPSRQPRRQPETASLYQAVTMFQVPAPLIVGERTNANGSREFRERLLADDLEGMVAVARDQERGGAHLLDVCVAYVGRDEQADMERLIPQLARQVRMPLVIDSTDPDVIEAALERHGGRCVINSINLEDGEERLDQVVTLARRFGAALVALVIDEEGMALTVERKLAVAQRIHRICTERHGLAPRDLIFDMLTFTVGSGDPEMRRAALETLAAIEQGKRLLPGIHTILGVSNVSFGLKPAARRILNSVFLAQAVERGLDQAIINARGITPLHRIPDGLRDICRRLIHADWSEGDPLTQLLEHYEDAMAAGQSAEAVEDLPPAEQLRRKIINGEKMGLEALLDGLRQEGRDPLDLVNGELIPAMKVVGDLFGSGQMQLPFVLQSAETMKAAVALLEPYLPAMETQSRGTLVLATVKGDVHDIGKNLVDIILSNNGYTVVNLGIKVLLEGMLAAAEEHGAHAIGMSGLLVKSTLVMKENLEEMKRRGLTIPVLLGGAALTRQFVEEDLRRIYGPAVHYGEDAFAALNLLGEIRGDGSAPEAVPDPDTDPLTRPRAESDKALSTATPRPGTGPQIFGGEVGGGDDLPAPTVDRTVTVPRAPWLGAREADHIPLEQLYPLLNETTLFRGQWRYRRGKLTREQWSEMIENEVRPVFEQLKRQCLEEPLLVPRGVVGWFHCHSENGAVVVHSTKTGGDPVRFSFPRRRTAPHHCIADYFRPGPGGEPDLIGLFAVTAGPGASKREKELFEAGHYRDYLHFHGFSVEIAEAAAEWLHARMREELGIAGNDQPGIQAIVRQGYRGSRYSFGYPACPDLEQQRPLFALLEPERIGITLSESCQMEPEQSVSAIVVHHPEAKYFNLA
jgi:5-methyltetrahydrofolate--homocysteine methyltransferase